MTATEEQIRQVVAEVLKRLLPQIGADGERGTVIAVFCGATVDYDGAVQQIRSLVMQGYRVQILFLAWSRGTVRQISLGSICRLPVYHTI